MIVLTLQIHQSLCSLSATNSQRQEEHKCKCCHIRQEVEEEEIKDSEVTFNMRTTNPAHFHCQSAPDCCQERSSRKTRRRLSPSLKGSEASSQPISLQLRESWKEEEERTLANSCSPFHARWPSEKTKFMNSVRCLSISKASTWLSAGQAAPVAKFADGCCIQIQGLASHGSCFQCT